jgi:hypothetical protein
MLDFDPKTSIMHWPTPMAKYGKNPHGENMYRVVFAPSRRYLVYGEWADGSRQASYVPKYSYIGNSWILERWMTPFQFARCTPQQWNESMTVLGPYPDRGEYEVAHVFDAVGIADSNLDKLIRWIEMGQDYSFSENRTACQKNVEYEEKERKRLRHDIIDDSLRALGTGPLSGYGGGRNTKTYPILKSAEELGLPTAPGVHSVRAKRKTKFEIPLGA